MGSYGWAIPRFLRVNRNPSPTPASRSRRRASARDRTMSRPYPASVSSSAGGVAYSVPGTCTPATSRTIVIFDRALAIP